MAPAREPLRERLVAGLLRLSLRATLLPAFRAGRPIPEQRRRLESISRLTLHARGVTYAPATVGGVATEVATSMGAGRPGAMLYLHGGAYCVGSPRTHRSITGALARRLGLPVFAADYRLAPEHPFPAALDDAVAAYRGLLAEGHAPGHIAIAGDSAGGGLTIAATLRLRALGVPLPGALVTFSPWVDLGRPDRGPIPNGEVMITPDWVDECSTFYRAGQPVDDPYVSPIHGDLAGLPPTLIQVGTDEVLLDDSRRLHRALERSGVTVEFREYARRWHVFQANARVLADADRALDEATRFVQVNCGG